MLFGKRAPGEGPFLLIPGIPWVNLWGAMANYYSNAKKSGGKDVAVAAAISYVHTPYCGAVVVSYVAMLLLSNPDVADKTVFSWKDSIANNASPWAGVKQCKASEYGAADQNTPMGFKLADSKLGQLMEGNKAKIAESYNAALKLGCAGKLGEDLWPKLCTSHVGRGIGIMDC